MKPAYTIFDRMEQCTEEEIARLLMQASRQRREKALPYKYLTGQYACLKSYAMLRELLIKAGVLSLHELPEFSYGPHGKPFLDSGAGVDFSISHCKAAIAVAIDTQPVGIDVECYRQPSPALLRYAMNDEEQERIASAENPPAMFTELWTQKEAVAKLTGSGITSDLKELLSRKPAHIALTTIHCQEKSYVCTMANTL